MLIIQFVITVAFSLGALASSTFIVYRILKRERQHLDETERHAFELFDAIFQSFIPRTLGDKLAHICRTEINPNAMLETHRSVAAVRPKPAVPDPSGAAPSSLVPSGAAVTASNQSALDKK